MHIILITMFSRSLIAIASCFLFFLAHVPGCSGQRRANLRNYRELTVAGLLTELSGTGGYDSNRLDFDILLSLVGAAGLNDAVNGGLSGVTMFAPTDGAFFQLAREFGFSGDYNEEAVFGFLAALVENIAEGSLQENLEFLLSYHVALEARSWRQLLNAGRVTTLCECYEIGIRRSRRRRRQLRILDDSVPHPSIVYQMSNYRVIGAFVHVINRVMIPPL